MGLNNPFLVNRNRNTLLNLNENNINNNNRIRYVSLFNNNIEDNKESNENKINIIKYDWLKKEKLTEEIIKKKEGEEYQCSICLEDLKLNDDIHILKCGHIYSL